MNELRGVIGEIRGEAVIRDKNGNVKGSFTFGGPATEAQVADMKNAFPNLMKGDENGSNTDHSGT